MNGYQSLSESLPFQSIHTWMLLILCLPFFGFLVLRLFGKKFPQGGQWIALGFMAASFLSALILIYQGWQQEMGEDIHLRMVWFNISGFDHPIHFTIGLRADSSAMVMCALVAAISTLVLLFSQEYMKKETHLDRYWAYLCLFVLAMQAIILADNLILIFVGWELVGLASYFLIGFFYTQEKPARAAQKAFLINRIGDTFFLMGMAILFSLTQTLDLNAIWGLLTKGEIQGDLFVITYNYLSAPVDASLIDPENIFVRELPLIWLQLAGLFIIGGALGKSAQFPLQTWLPDAMAGPTPVSSLIHAATMVAAGVYLVSRVYFFLFSWVQVTLAIIGAVTALMAASAALTQWDIKRILAYSTISQLGYMMMGMGVGVYDDAMMHLITHAFFKCGLFLVAAVIIHQLHHLSSQPQEGIPPYNDIRNMGGLWKEQPVLFRLFMFMMLALAGIPFTSGFVSKEGIIMGTVDWAERLQGVSWLIPAMALIGVGLTAYYMGRMTMWVFISEKRNDVPKQKIHWKMAVPLFVMALGSFWFPIFTNPFENFGYVSHAFPLPIQLFQVPPLPGIGHDHLVWTALSVSLAIGGLGMAYWHFNRKKTGPSRHALEALSFHHFYQDFLYEHILAKGVFAFAAMWKWIDQHIIDGTIKWVAMITHNQDLPSDSSFEPQPTADRDALPNGFSLARLAEWIDVDIFDRLVNYLVRGIQYTGTYVSSTQSGKVQRYFIGIILSAAVIVLIASLLV
ncbi:MAG: NADH-quinone oxidoreductase subunit L [Bacteroidota bacterium]